MTRNEIITYLCAHPGSRLDRSPVVISLERDNIIKYRNGVYYLTPIGWRIATWRYN